MTTEDKVKLEMTKNIMDLVLYQALSNFEETNNIMYEYIKNNDNIEVHKNFKYLKLNMNNIKSEFANMKSLSDYKVLEPKMNDLFYKLEEFRRFILNF